MEKVSADLIISWLTGQVENRKVISKDDWLEIAFKLNVLYLPEVEKLESMRQKVAYTKLQALRVQEKRNVAAADLEVEATDEFREMKIQEAKIDQIKEFIRIAKKNTENL